jgi:hypothetical protein
MNAIEFKTILAGNAIKIPESFQSELSLSKDKPVRVIVIIDELEKHEDIGFKILSGNQSPKGLNQNDSFYNGL